MGSDENGNGSGNGTLRQAFGNLEGRVDTFERNWEKQDERAERSRRILFDKMEGVGRDVQNLSHRVATVAGDVATMKPAVTDWVNSKHEGIGEKSAIKTMTTVLWNVGGAIVVGAAWLAEHLLLH